MYKVERGLDLPITGSASGEIVDKRTEHVAVLAGLRWYEANNVGSTR